MSPDLVSAVTDVVLETVNAWQGCPLDTCYPLVFFDAIGVKIRDEGFVRNKAAYITLGIRPDGTKEILGIWIEQSKGAKCWLRVMNELKHRGLGDILIAVVTGLKGFAEAINAFGERSRVHPRSPIRLTPRNRRSDLHRASHPQRDELCLMEGP